MNISDFKKKSIARILVVSFFFSLFATYHPKRVEALIPSVDPSSAGLLVKEMVLDPAAWVLVKLLMKGLVASMTKWVDSGFDGAPLFATDPGKFLAGVGDNVFGDFIKSAGFGALCSPFRVQVQAALNTKYVDSKIGSRDPYNASCRLSTITGNVQQFFDGDFNQGGWDAWYSLTQDPQGNPYSAIFDAQTQASIRLSGESSIELARLDWANGFISFSDCVRKDANGKCVERGPTKTPGLVIAEKLNLGLGSDIRTLEASDEISELLGALLNQVIGKVFTGAKGLFSNTGSGTDSGVTTGTDINPNFPTSLTVYLVGPNPQNVELGQPYLDYGAYAIDPVDGNIPSSNISTSGTVNVNVSSTYPIVYAATNSSGNTAQITRDVIVSTPTSTGGETGIVPDPSTEISSPPTIKLFPPLVYSIKVGNPYNDPGFDASDYLGTDLNYLVSVSGGPVDWNAVNTTYTLSYDVTDPLTGFRAITKTRTVNVVP